MLNNMLVNLNKKTRLINAASSEAREKVTAWKGHLLNITTFDKGQARVEKSGRTIHTLKSECVLCKIEADNKIKK
jgi:hypothetical protein